MPPVSLPQWLGKLARMPQGVSPGISSGGLGSWDVRREAMAIGRLSCLQKQILRWLGADYRRSRGVTSSSHEELVKALGGYKGNISRSLQTLETRG
jgi:hypothetical protein